MERREACRDNRPPRFRHATPLAMHKNPDSIDSTHTAVELIRLLHRGAPAEEFAQWRADAEAGGSPLLEVVHMAMAVRNRIELLEQRERGLLAVNESAQNLASRLDLKGLLGAIVARARNLLGSDLAWLSI